MTSTIPAPAGVTLTCTTVIELDIRDRAYYRVARSPSTTHGTVETLLFHNTGPRSLWRLDQGREEAALTIRSATEPDVDNMKTAHPGLVLDARTVPTVEPALGDAFVFAARLNPVTSHKHTRTPITGHEELLVWFDRQGEVHGFAVHPAAPLTLGAPRQAGFNHAGKDSVKFSTVDFTGIITVTDQEKFGSALANGIGRQKAHGCGLIILNPGR